jgi:hypothetical protein
MTRRRRALAAAAVVLVLALAGAGLWLYLRVWRYTPTAHRHLPPDAGIAIRADANQLVEFAPFREHILPLVLARQPADRKRISERLFAETGIRLRDLHEIVVASTSPTSWVAIAGGRLERGRFVAGLERVFAAEGIGGWQRDGELLVHALGPAVGQADDGSLVAGTTAAIVRAALPAHDPDPAVLPLPVDGALSLAANATAWRTVVGFVPAAAPGAATLARADRLRGTLTLDDAPRLDLRLVPASGTTPAALAEALDGDLAKIRLFLLLVPHDLFGGKKALGDANVTASGNEVLVSAPWPYDKLDEAMKQLAELLRRM